MPQPTEPDHAAIDAAETAMHTAVTAVITEWLALAQRAVITGTTGDTTAAADDWRPHMDAWPRLQQWVRLLRENLTAVYRNIWRGAWSHVTPNTPPPDGPLSTFIQDRIQLLSSSTLPDEVHAKVLEQVAEWRDTPEKAADLRTRIKTVFNEENWQGHTDLIARTEAVGTYNDGAYNSGLHRQEIMGDTLYKQWIATPDQRVRPSHWYANLQVRDSSEPFDVGHSQMRYPHDPRGPIGEVANCRCALAWLDEEEADEQKELYRKFLPNRTTVDGEPLSEALNAAGWNPNTHPRTDDGRFTGTPTNTDVTTAPLPGGTDRPHMVGWIAAVSSLDDPTLSALSTPHARALHQHAATAAADTSLPSHARMVARHMADRLDTLHTLTEPDPPVETEPVTAQSGMPHGLEHYWTRGEGAAKIRWGTDGAFDRCVRNLREYVSDPQGTCANLEHAATGFWPADDALPSSATPPTEGTPMSTSALAATVTGATDLPLADPDTSWDGDAARSKISDWAGGDPDKLAKAFLWRDPDTDGTAVSHYKLPFATVIGGTLKAVPAGLFAAAAAVDGARGGVDIPDDALGRVKSRIAGYYHKLGRKAPWESDDSGDSQAAAKHDKRSRDDDSGDTDDEQQDEQDDTPDSNDDPDQDDDFNDSGKGKRKDKRTTTTAALDAAPVTATWADLVAATAPVEPPAAWFTDPQLTEPMKVRVTDEGRVVGHIAAWGVEHASLPGVTAPRDPYGGLYPRFHRHGVRTADGSRIKTGPLSTGPQGHADLNDPLGAVIDHYDSPNFVAADVVAGEDAHGIWVSGALRPGVSPEQVWMLDRYSISGDWRDNELVAACTVAVPGFHLADTTDMVPALAAAAARLPSHDNTAPRTHTTTDGAVLAMVAAGMLPPPAPAPTAAPALDGWRLYREFKAARHADTQLAATRRRLHAPTAVAAAARIRNGGQ